MDRQRKTDRGGSQEAKTPQTSEGQTRTLSPDIPMEIALLDRELSIEDLPTSAFPESPQKDGLCLVCGIVKRMQHSWFCRKECEASFIEDFNHRN